MVSLYLDVQILFGPSVLSVLWYSGNEGSLCGSCYDEKVTKPPLIAKSSVFAEKTQESLGWAYLETLEKEAAS